MYKRTPSLLTSALLASWASPALAQDIDNDGVPDAIDVFPCDSGAASVQYAPSRTSWTTLTFEDQWPAWTDLDFNDVVIRVHQRIHRDASGDALRVTMLFEPVALGGNYSNGLAIQMPVPATGATIERRVRGGGAPGAIGNWQAVLPEVDSNLTFIASDNLRELFGGAAGPLNVLPGAPALTGSILEVRIELPNPTPLDAGQAPFDVFVFRTGDFSHQIHFPRYSGTFAMNASMFNTQFDASSSGRHFVHRNGVPFALDIRDAAYYPKEGVAVELLYPDILGFASSGGTQNEDFYATTIVPSEGWVAPTTAVPAEDPVETTCVDNRQFMFSLSGTSYNPDLSGDMMAAGWDGVQPVALKVTIEPGAVVGSADTANGALEIPALPVGSWVLVANHGRIQGAGGRGGNGGPQGLSANRTPTYGWGEFGQPGGPALVVGTDIHLDNRNGEIWGGGGGGAGGTGTNSTSGGASGGGGGGGAGSVPGAGGSGSRSGAPGTATVGGQGGALVHTGQGATIPGVAGGGPGQPGRNQYSQRQGGAAGAAVDAPGVTVSWMGGLDSARVLGPVR